MDTEYELVPIESVGESKPEGLAERRWDPWSDATVSLRPTGAGSEEAEREVRLRVIRARRARRLIVRRATVLGALAISVTLAIVALERSGGAIAEPGKLRVAVAGPARAAQARPKPSSSGRGSAPGRRRGRERRHAAKGPRAQLQGDRGGDEPVVATPSASAAPPATVATPVQEPTQPDPAPITPPPSPQPETDKARAEFGFEH